MADRDAKDIHAPEFDEINTLKLWDFRIEDYQGGKLVIVGGTDLTYYHQCEITFDEVDYIACAADFSHPLFRQATANEINDLPGHNDFGGPVWCIVSEHGGDPEGPFYFVAAASVTCKTGTVYHYERENLKPGERIASWVKD